MSAKSETERNRISDIHEHGVDTEHFMIYLQGVEESPSEDYEEPGIEYRISNRFIKNLDVLTGISPDRPITISMKTCGGDWYEGMAIFDAIIAAPNPVSIINYTHARSMSSLIFQAANKRIMLPHSVFMYHEGTSAAAGTVKQVETDMEFSKASKDQMLKIYIDAIKRTPHSNMNKWGRDRIKKRLIKEMNDKEDVYLTAEDSIKQGFADEMFSDWSSVVQYADWQMERK